MHWQFLTFILWSSLAWLAHGVSVEIPITTTNLEQQNYIFSVSTNAARNGVTFHVTITAKKEDIPADSRVGLSIVRHERAGGGETHSISGIEPEIPITLKKNARVWGSEFTLSDALMEKPGLYFVFTEIAHTIVDGKRVAMPSADFYEIRLRDFLKR